MPVEIAYQPLRREDGAALAAFLAGEPWPFHSGGQVADGYFDSASVRTHWILADGRRCGFVKAFDLDDGTPLFDLRLAAAYRGRGIGTAAVAWLTRYLFELLPDINRVEATTRADNAAMRAVLKANGYVKEAHYRQAWPDKQGFLHDTIGYAILRRDWLSGSPTPVNWNDEKPPR
jgi:RimJ/RimL family protein N-acetyltransferase